MYDYKTCEAIDKLDEILETIGNDYDIHDIILDISIKYDVDKNELLEYYDSKY